MASSAYSFFHAWYLVDDILAGTRPVLSCTRSSHYFDEVSFSVFLTPDKILGPLSLTFLREHRVHHNW